MVFPCQRLRRYVIFINAGAFCVLAKYNFLNPNNMTKLVYFAFAAFFAIAVGSCGSKSSGSNEAKAGANSELSDPGKVAAEGQKAFSTGQDFLKYLEPSASEGVKAGIQKYLDKFAADKEAQANYKGSEAVNVEVNGDQATVSVCQIVSMAGGEEWRDTSDVHLVKIDGNWYFRASDYGLYEGAQP